jgi:hypothetical protein
MKKNVLRISVVLALVALLLFVGIKIGSSINLISAAEPIESTEIATESFVEETTVPATEETTVPVIETTVPETTVPVQTTTSTEPTTAPTEPSVPETSKPQEETTVPTQPEVEVETEGETEEKPVVIPETTEPETKPETETTHVHNYVVVSTVKATCTTKGYSTYKCECGDRYDSDHTDATAHNYHNGMCTGCGTKDPNYQETTPETEPVETEPVVENEPKHNHDNCSNCVEVQIGSYTYVYCECIESPYREGNVIYYPYSFYF